MDKHEKIIRQFLWDMQGSARYKGIDKLSTQKRQEKQIIKDIKFVKVIVA